MHTIPIPMRIEWVFFYLRNNARILRDLLTDNELHCASNITIGANENTCKRSVKFDFEIGLSIRDSKNRSIGLIFSIFFWCGRSTPIENAIWLKATLCIQNQLYTLVHLSIRHNEVKLSSHNKSVKRSALTFYSLFFPGLLAYSTSHRLTYCVACTAIEIFSFFLFYHSEVLQNCLTL